MTCLWFKIQYQTISEMNVHRISQKRQREANRKIISSTTYDDHPGRTCGRKDSVRFPTSGNMSKDNSRINRQNVNNSPQSPQKDVFKKSEMYMKQERSFSERNQTQRSPVQSLPMESTSPPRPKIMTASEIPASSLKSNISRVPNVEETPSQKSPTDAYTRCGKVKLPSTLPPGNKTLIVKTCSRTMLKEHNELTVNYSISEQIRKQPFQNAEKEKLWQIEDKGLNSAGSMMEERSKSKSVDTVQPQSKDENDKEEGTGKFSISSSKASTVSKQTTPTKLSQSRSKSKSITNEVQRSSSMKSPVAEKTPDKEPSVLSQSIRSITEIITVSSRSLQTNDTSEDSSSSEGSSACSNDTSTTTEKKKKKKCCMCF